MKLRRSVLESSQTNVGHRIADRQHGALFSSLFPDEGPLRRELYPKHMEFFAAGAIYRERCAMAANRVGKTLGMGGYETTCHLTGLYPHWWPGRRFAEPVDWWACGKTDQTTRDIVQHALCGDVVKRPTGKVFNASGLIPGGLLGRTIWSRKTGDLADIQPVRHASGGWSHLGFKSYMQGRGAYEGVARHGVWLDEEPPIGIYGECVVRTTTTGGIVMMTFTPLDGITRTVVEFLPSDQRPS